TALNKRAPHTPPALPPLTNRPPYTRPPVSRGPGPNAPNPKKPWPRPSIRPIPHPLTPPLRTMPLQPLVPSHRTITKRPPTTTLAFRYHSFRYHLLRRLRYHFRYHRRPRLRHTPMP